MASLIKRIKREGKVDPPSANRSLPVSFSSTNSPLRLSSAQLPGKFLDPASSQKLRVPFISPFLLGFY